MHLTTLPKPKAVLFDWDGVILDNEGAIYESLFETFDHFGVPRPSTRELTERFGLSARDNFPAYFGEKSEEVYRYYYAKHCAKPFDPKQIFSYAKEFLEVLNTANIFCAVVSNKHGDLLRKEVESSGFSPYFKKVVGSRDAPRDKPHPDPVYFALSETEINPTQSTVWFIGDRVTDMECAHKTNCIPIEANFTPSKIDADAPYQPVLKIQTFSALINILKSVLKSDT